MNEKMTRQNALALWALLTAVFAASLCLPLPGRTGQIAHLPSLCLFYHLTGLPCPGCGLTRAFVCLAHGQWRDSLHWHPLGWLVFLVCIVVWVRCGLLVWFGIALRPLAPGLVTRLGWSACALLLAADAARIGWLSAHHLRF